MSEQIYYRAGYKYQLAADYETQLTFAPPNAIHTKFVNFYENGKLIVYEGYAWDGPSGPTADLPYFMRGSLVHDALYGLMQADLLNRVNYRNLADLTLVRLCEEDKMPPAQVYLTYQGVKLFGDPYATPGNGNPIIKAPGDPVIFTADTRA